MIKSFKKELKLIGSNKRITEKLMTIAIYNEFYNDIIETVDPNLKEQYSAIMEKTFEVVVRGINSHKSRNITALKFMKLYFSAIRKNNLFTNEPFNQIINNIENQLPNASKTLSFVPIIDQHQELPLEAKIDIMAEFRDYANNVLFISLKSIFESNTISNNVLNDLINKLSTYLKYCKNNNIDPNKISKNIKPIMMETAKNSLVYKLDGNEFMQKAENGNEFTYYNSLNELEQKVWVMDTIYNIAGYDQDNNKERVKEICNFLGISKLRYTLTNLAMDLHALNTISKYKNNNNKTKNAR